MRGISDCDPGNGVPGANVDDAVALVYALNNPNLHVEAIWTVFGNTSAREGARAARKLLADLDVHDIRVREGWDAPISGARSAHRARLDAPSQDPDVYRLWGIAEPPRRESTQAEAEPLSDLVADLTAGGEDIVLICLGPLTNPARLLDAAPEAMSRVSHIYLMGGHLAEKGTVDTNFAVDPAAASRVLGSSIPLTIIPLDVTRTTELTETRWRQIVAATGGGVSEFVLSIRRWLEPWLAYSNSTRPVEGMWLHDLVAVAAAAEPELVTRESVALSILESPAGKLRFDPDGTTVDLITTVDGAALTAAWERSVTMAADHNEA